MKPFFTRCSVGLLLLLTALVDFRLMSVQAALSKPGNLVKQPAPNAGNNIISTDLDEMKRRKKRDAADQNTLIQEELEDVKMRPIETADFIITIEDDILRRKRAGKDIVVEDQIIHVKEEDKGNNIIGTDLDGMKRRQKRDAVWNDIISTDLAEMKRRKKRDAAGNKIIITDLDGMKTRKKRDAEGNIIIGTDLDGMKRRKKRDAAGNNIVITDVDEMKRRKKRDAAGNKIIITDLDGMKRRRKRDAAGNKIIITDLDGMKRRKKRGAEGENVIIVDDILDLEGSPHKAADFITVEDDILRRKRAGKVKRSITGHVADLRKRKSRNPAARSVNIGDRYVPFKR